MKTKLSVWHIECSRNFHILSCTRRVCQTLLEILKWLPKAPRLKPTTPGTTKGQAHWLPHPISSLPHIPIPQCPSLTGLLPGPPTGRVPQTFRFWHVPIPDSERPTTHLRSAFMSAGLRSLPEPHSGLCLSPSWVSVTTLGLIISFVYHSL